MSVREQVGKQKFELEVEPVGLITSKITDEDISGIQKRIGEEIIGQQEEWQVDESRLLRSRIRHWAVMIGDMNPLYLDLEYAEKTKWGTIICPPGILLEAGQLEPGIDIFPGSRGILTSVSLQWNIPLKYKDVLFGRTWIREVRDITGDPSQGRVACIEYESRGINQNGEEMGTVRETWNCCERGSKAERELFRGREPAFYTHEDIEQIGEEYAKEEVRGAEARYWEDVKIGDDLPPVIKGPTTFNATNLQIKRVGRGISWWYGAHGGAFEIERERPGLFFLNEHGAPEPILTTDWDHVTVRQFQGLPGAIELNSERVHWIIQLLTNWQGDNGFVWKLDLTFPKLNLLGDTTWCRGRVVDKHARGKDRVVAVEVWTDNQAEEKTTEGTAEIILPAKPK